MLKGQSKKQEKRRYEVSVKSAMPKVNQTVSPETGSSTWRIMTRNVACCLELGAPSTEVTDACHRCPESSLPMFKSRYMLCTTRTY